ncbi:MAG TPA: CHASE sensor domain-containing protein, partial [Thermoanaerobaculia bacterium]|nr:CHASE sensor domain-containing protein [Thermoanaerobaculia bacterium]
MIQRLLQNVPIRQKLILLIMLATGLALLLAGVVLIVFEYVRSREEMKEDLASLAEVIAQNSTAVLSFDDPDAARDTLKTLEARESIVAGAIYDQE